MFDHILRRPARNWPLWGVALGLALLLTVALGASILALFDGVASASPTAARAPAKPATVVILDDRAAFELLACGGAMCVDETGRIVYAPRTPPADRGL